MPESLSVEAGMTEQRMARSDGWRLQYRRGARHSLPPVERTEATFTVPV